MHRPSAAHGSQAVSAWHASGLTSASPAVLAGERRQRTEAAARSGCAVPCGRCRARGTASCVPWSLSLADYTPGASCIARARASGRTCEASLCDCILWVQVVSIMFGVFGGQERYVGWMKLHMADNGVTNATTHRGFVGAVGVHRIAASCTMHTRSAYQSCHTWWSAR
jgi:hypothetical protein